MISTKKKKTKKKQKKNKKQNKKEKEKEASYFLTSTTALAIKFQFKKFQVSYKSSTD